MKNKSIMLLICFSIIFVLIKCQVIIPEPVLKIPNLTDYVYNSTYPILDKDLQEEYDLLEKSVNRTKLLACLVVVRNSLAKGNDDVTKAMKETKLDKGKTFDKIYAMMLVNCNKEVSEEQVNDILNPENVILVNTRYLPLLKINMNFIKIIGPEPKLNEEELDIIKQVKEAEANKENIQNFIEVNHQINTKGVNQNQILGLGLNKSEEYFVIGGIISVLAFIMFIFVMRNLKPESSDSNSDKIN